jgi:pheromone shutdown protein TraB
MLSLAFDIVEYIPRTAHKGPVVVVGEHHTDSASRRLVRTALISTAPHIIALETCPERVSLLGPDGGSIGEQVARAYAANHDVPLAFIDDTQSALLDIVSDLPDEPSPPEPPKPKQTGDIDARALRYHRAIHQNVAPHRFASLWTRREQHMAEFIESLRREHLDRPVVAIVGAVHVTGLSAFLQNGSLAPADTTCRVSELT